MNRFLNYVIPPNSGIKILGHTMVGRDTERLFDKCDEHLTNLLKVC